MRQGMRPRSQLPLRCANGYRCQWKPIGHLDDAILVDALWPQIEGELRDDIAFRYLRRIEAERYGISPARLAFTRRDKEQEWPALQGLCAHFPQAGLHCYTPAELGSKRVQVH
jgi:hypothetical protein